MGTRMNGGGRANTRTVGRARLDRVWGRGERAGAERDGDVSGGLPRARQRCRRHLARPCMRCPARASGWCTRIRVHATRRAWGYAPTCSDVIVVVGVVSYDVCGCGGHGGASCGGPGVRAAGGGGAYWVVGPASPLVGFPSSLLSPLHLSPLSSPLYCLPMWLCLRWEAASAMSGDVAVQAGGHGRSGGHGARFSRMRCGGHRIRVVGSCLGWRNARLSRWEAAIERRARGWVLGQKPENERRGLDFRERCAVDLGFG